MGHVCNFEAFAKLHGSCLLFRVLRYFFFLQVFNCKQHESQAAANLFPFWLAPEILQFKIIKIFSSPLANTCFSKKLNTGFPPKVILEYLSIYKHRTVRCSVMNNYCSQGVVSINFILPMSPLSKEHAQILRGWPQCFLCVFLRDILSCIIKPSQKKKCCETHCPSCHSAFSAHVTDTYTYVCVLYIQFIYIC